ncbi:MAG: alpha/beta fold hydrolase [Anaerolineae bacterium]
MPTLELKQKRIFYTRQPGRSHGPTLLLIHGAGGTHLTWPLELRRFAEAVVITLDLPGHGRSQPPARTDITDYADDVAAVIDALQLENVIVVGHSMGGAIAQTLALRHRDKVAGLVLIGAGARLPVSDAILGQALTDFPAAVAFITRYSWAKNTPSALVADGREIMLNTDPTVLYGDFVACNRFNVMERLPQIRVPTLVIAGTDDKMTPHKFGRYLADHISQANLLTLDGAGHMMMLEQPGPVTAAIAVFLRRYFGG